MFGIFKGNKEKTQKPGIDDIVIEKWDTSFKRSEEKRFEFVEEQGYSLSRSKKGYHLRINRENCFAWGDNRLYRYYDFFIEGEISFDAENGHSAAGFLLRKIADEHYYYFLVSNTGYFRFDLVRNDEPQVLIGWSPCPEPVNNTIFLRIIARGDEFVFLVNEEWVGTFRDETIDGGRIAFGAQNYGEKPHAEFTLNQFRVNSIPMDVETAYERWTQAIPPTPESRAALGETLFSQGLYGPAAVQLKKAFSLREPKAEELFLLGECYLKSEMYSEALSVFDDTLKIKPDFIKAKLEKANILYLTNEFLALRDAMDELLKEYPERSICWNLMGHAEYGIGNWKKAASAYGKAAELDDQMPLYRIHQARALEHDRKSDEALSIYLKAADVLFRQEAYMDLDGLIPVLDKLDNGNKEVRSVHGKMAFHRGEYSEAKKIFEDILQEETKDSSVYFLFALCLIIEGKRDLATEYLFKATELEPEYYLYWFRLAENLYLLELDAHDEVQKALELSPEEPWVLNLAGLIELNAGNLDTAEKYLSSAWEKESGEEDISINLSQVLASKGKFEEARKILDGFEQTAVILNQHANILVEENKYEDALRMYEKALASDPENVDFLFNCGTVCLELDHVIRAEELFAHAMEISPAPHLYLKLGDVAMRKGEYYRAEVILEEAVETFTEEMLLWRDYLVILMVRNQSRKADLLLDKLREEHGEKDEFKVIENYLHDRYYREYSCDKCECSWYVPNNIEKRTGVDIVGRPDEGLPAGKCSVCGKVYCIRCASSSLDENKFLCLDCRSALKISEDWINYLLTRNLEDSDEN